MSADRVPLCPAEPRDHHARRPRPLGWLALFTFTTILGACERHAASEFPADAPALRQADDPWVDACEPAEPDAEVELSLSTLLSQMVDLTALARLPDPPFSSQLASSHDTASDAAAPGDEAWFANRDFLFLEGPATITLLDVEGPGVITRLWSAAPNGVLRIYMDGASEPTVAAPLEALLSGRVEPFTPPFAFVAGRGYNLYFPIPFARAVRITLTGPAVPVFYHIGYRLYPAGTRLQSFGPDAVKQSASTLERVRERLAQLQSMSLATDVCTDSSSFDLDTASPANAALITARSGGGVIWQLRLSGVQLDATALRATVLRIAFDGTETVRVPLGDFFAQGSSVRAIHSVPVGVDPGGVLTARWPMPFEREARIAVESTGLGETTAQLEVLHGELPFTERSLHFHARWTPPDTFPAVPSSDWTLAQIEGRGMYVGSVLNVLNPVASWWGEGDEKIYIDGEPFPSHFGTGTEDYFGYAYCTNESFTTSYVGHPVTTSRRNFGHEGMYRFHVLDPIPFERALRFDMEVTHWDPPTDVTYDATSFWYARPDGKWANPRAANADYRIPSPDIAQPADIKPGPYHCR